MRHRISGKQLSRTASHRKAMLRNMAASLIQHETVRTTEPKAKQLRPFVERVITIARQGTLHARRRVISLLGDRDMVDDEGQFQDKTVVQKLFDEIAPRYANRAGGYTRIIRISDRRIGDSGVQVLLQLVEETSAKTEDAQRGERRRRRATKRHEAAASVSETQQAPDSEEVPEEQAPQEAPPDRSDQTGDTRKSEDQQD